MSEKKYLSLDGLTSFLSNLRSTFADKTHTHIIEQVDGLQENLDVMRSSIDDATEMANTQPDWNVGDASSPAYINNKPFYTDETWSATGEPYYFNHPSSIEGNVVKFDVGMESGVAFIRPFVYQIIIQCPEYSVEEIQSPSSDDYFYGGGYEIEYLDGVVIATLPVEVTDCDITVTLGEVDYYTKTIDYDYLPIIQPDWSDNDENSRYYIQNRTHYEIYTTGMECTLSELSYSEYGVNEDGEAVYYATGSNPDFFLESDGTYVVNYPDYSVACIADNCSDYGLYDDFTNKVFIGNVSILTNSGYNSGEPFLIVQDAVGEYTVYLSFADGATEFSIQAETHTVKQLDEMFIPDSIARASDITAIAIDQIDSICGNSIVYSDEVTF